MPFLSNLILIYFAIISLVAVVITVADKIFAQKGMWRIPEATLMIVGLLGGALAMFIAMRTIRHKTKHKKFMIGLPLIMILQIAVITSLIILAHV